MRDYTKQEYRKMRVAHFVSENFTNGFDKYTSFEVSSIIYWNDEKDKMVVSILVENAGFARSFREEIKITGNESYCDLLEFASELKDLAFQMSTENFIEASK